MIFASSPDISGEKKHVCLKVIVGDYEVSLSLDNSLGAFDTLRRGNLVIFDTGTDTILHNSPVWGPVDNPTAGQLVSAIEWAQVQAENRSVAKTQEAV